MRDHVKTAPLSTATVHILLALAGEDRHGYGIIQEVSRDTEKSYRIGPGTLYDNLKKMMDAGLVADVSRVAENRDERRFYTLTVAGGAALAAEMDRMARVVKVGRMRLGKADA